MRAAATSGATWHEALAHPTGGGDVRQPRRRGRQRARDGRQACGGRRQGHEGGPRIPGTGRVQGAGCTGARPGACSLRPGDGRVRARAAGTALAVSFGDAFPPGSFLRSGGLMACADAGAHAEPDTARALLAFYVPAGLANCHAGDWWYPPTRGSPAPAPGWPPRGRSASAWNTLMTLT